MQSEIDPRRIKVFPRPAYKPLTEMPEVTRDMKQIAEGLQVKMLQLIAGVLPWPLTLIGNTGSGKTCAALCLCDYFGGWFAELSILHQRLQDVREGSVCWDGPVGCKVSVTDFWKTWKSMPLAVLDEVGSKTPTEAMYETLRMAINTREEKPLVVISNLEMEQLGLVYDQRIISRLIAGTPITLTGDRRLAK